MRFGFAAIVLGLSSWNIPCALRFGSFEPVFRKMLASLPAISAWAFQWQPVLAGLSIAIPVLSVVLIFVGRLKYAVFLNGVLILMIFFELFFVWHALAEPCVRIFTDMQEKSHE